MKTGSFSQVTSFEFVVTSFRLLHFLIEKPKVSERIKTRYLIQNSLPGAGQVTSFGSHLELV